MKCKTLLAATAGACLLSTGAFATTTTPSYPASCAPFGTDATTANKTLQTALAGVVKAGGNGGLGFNMWATLVGNDGAVCAVAFSGASYTDQWLASRIISAQKAATANSLSLATVSGASSAGQLALASGNLYSADREGGSLFGLQFSNPVDPANAYGQAGQPGTLPNASADFGKSTDPLVGLPVGGINVFGGGLALYTATGKVGGLGVSGDTSCTDHMVAWKTRNALNLDYLKTAGISGPAKIFANDPKHPDNLIFDIPNNTQGVGPNKAPVEGNNAISQTGFGHPYSCLTPPAQQQNGSGYPPTAGGLPEVR